MSLTDLNQDDLNPLCESPSWHPESSPGHEGRWGVDHPSGAMAYWCCSILSQENTLGSRDEIREQAHINSLHPACSAVVHVQMNPSPAPGPAMSCSSPSLSQHQTPVSSSSSRADWVFYRSQMQKEGTLFLWMLKQQDQAQLPSGQVVIWRYQGIAGVVTTYALLPLRGGHHRNITWWNSPAVEHTHLYQVHPAWCFWYLTAKFKATWKLPRAFPIIK